jgi:hypothetical protein
MVEALARSSAPLHYLELLRITLLETVWKLGMGLVSWSHESPLRGEMAYFSALRATDKRAIRPVQILSRQSLYEVG